MNEEVRRLLQEERVVEAATLASSLGDHAAASQLFERACAWKEAALAALAQGDAARAVVMAATGDANEVAETALERLRGAAPSQLGAVAATLRQRGQLAWAAKVLEAAGATTEAAELWQRAGDAVRAAHLLEGEGGSGLAAAGRALEAALRRDPGRDDVRVALGGLLLRSGKPAPALRTLQQVPEGSPSKREALDLVVRALGELGMQDARAEAVAQLAAHGGPVSRGAAPSAQVAAPDGAGPEARARLYGRYEVLREVTSTATARLLECRDVIRGERVAVKLFSAQASATRGAGRDALARFVREARVLAQLAHPNVVPLREVLEQGPALVLEWMPGGTLEERLAAERFTPARAASVACAILGALGEAHRLGVVHRDLKPANILFDAAGTPRLSDFGVAHLGDLSVTATAGSFGSLAYMSPEQREGRPATAQSDLFGVGVVLLEMLTGTLARSRAMSLDAATVPPLRDTHRHLGEAHDRALASLLARDPSQRPPDAFAAARALASLPWPADVDGASPSTAAAARQATPISVHPPPLRLALDVEAPGAEAAAALQGEDRWLARRVVCLPLTGRALRQASAFAAAHDRALQPVLRVDRDNGLLWLAAPRGELLSREGRALRADERAALARALSRLHAAGGVHGVVDARYVSVGEAGPVLLMPLDGGPDGGSPEADLTALAGL